MQDVVGAEVIEAGASRVTTAAAKAPGGTGGLANAPTSLPARSLGGDLGDRIGHPRMRIYTTRGAYSRVAMEMLTGRWRSGDAVGALERAIESRVETRHAIAMPMARTAIYHAVKALIAPGQKVVLSPYTIADVVNMVICAGGVPVFADLEPGHVNVSASEIESLVDAETGAVMVTHFYGEACDITRIAAFCKARGVPLIEDAAQAFGVKVDGRQLGTFGDVGIFSFGMYKYVNAFYGGMLITNRDDVAAAVRAAIADAPVESAGRYLSKVKHGLMTDVLTWPPVFRSFTFRLFRWAYLNGVESITNKTKIDIAPQMLREMPAAYLHQMSPLQARLILSQLDGVADALAKRIAHAQRYHDGLQGLPGLILPPLRLDGSHGYAYYCIHFEDRARLVRFAQTHGRDIQESYHRNCAALDCFSAFARHCPNAEKVAASVIYVPSYPRYPVAEVDRTIAVIRRFFEADA